MKKAMIFISVFLAACLCRAGSYEEFFITTHSSTSATAITGYANPFVGEIYEVDVYTPSGVTGAVCVSVIDAYSGADLVLGTNAAVSGRWIWRPRIDPPASAGLASLVVAGNTNEYMQEMFYANSERIKAVVSDASATNQKFRIRIKIK